MGLAGLRAQWLMSRACAVGFRGEGLVFIRGLL